YAVMGEMVAWLVGWALILEYALGASAVAVGWSGHIVGLLDSIGMHLPHAITVGPKISWGFLQGGEIGGYFNLPAGLIVGFVSTAAEETKNPQRNVPIGLIGSLAICTIFYLLVAGGAVGAYGAQPVLGPDGLPFKEGSPELYASAACQVANAPLVCSKEALAHV